jgi:hypothetical protein
MHSLAINKIESLLPAMEASFSTLAEEVGQ